MPSAERVRWAKFRVTAVTLVAILILLTLSYLLTGGTLLSQTVDIYLYMPDAAGLEKDAPVRLNGVDVGKVVSVSLTDNPDRNRTIRVKMAFDRPRLPALFTNSSAEISSDSLIGDKFVDVTSRPAPTTIPPGGELNLKPDSDLMKTVDIQQLQVQIRTADALLRDLEEGRGPVGEFVQGRQMYDDVTKRFTEIEAALRAAVSITTDVGKALHTDDLYQSLFAKVMEIDNTLAQLQAGQGPMGKMLKDPAQYEQWRGMLADMRKSIGEMRTSPMVQSDDMYTAWNRNLSMLIQQVDELNANPAFNTSDVYDSFTGMAKEMHETVRDFRLHPQKYLWMKIF